MPKAERGVKRNKLDLHWLKRIRAALVDQICAQLEELENDEYTPIMRAFKPQFCVSIALVFCLVCFK